MNDFTWCQIAYNNKWATKEQLQVWVSSRKITPAEYYTITKDTAYLKTLVDNNSITSEQYKEITGVDYITQ